MQIKIFVMMLCIIAAVLFSGCKESAKSDSVRAKELAGFIEAGLKEVKSLWAKNQELEIEIVKRKKATSIQLTKNENIAKLETMAASARTNKLSVKELEKILNDVLIEIEELKTQRKNLEYQLMKLRP